MNIYLHISRTNQIIPRTNQIIPRTNQIIPRTNQIIPRLNQMRKHREMKLQSDRVNRCQTLIRTS